MTWDAKKSRLEARKAPKVERRAPVAKTAPTPPDMAELERMTAPTPAKPAPAATPDMAPAPAVPSAKPATGKK